MDADWKIDVKKSSAQLPPVVRDRLKKVIERIQVGSKRTYSKRGQKLVDQERLPMWHRIQADGQIRYRPNTDHPAFADFAESPPPDLQRGFFNCIALVGASLPIETLHADMADTAEQIVPDRVDEDTLLQAVRSTLSILGDAGKDTRNHFIDEGCGSVSVPLRGYAAHHRQAGRDEGGNVNPVLSSLEGMTSMYMASQTGPHTAELIRDIIAQLRFTPMFSGRVEDDEAEKLARLIEEKYGISMGLGAIVDAEDFRPWLHDARIKGEIGEFYWSRYRKLLNLKGLPKSVIDATDEVTDRVLDRLGDPRNTKPWSRRGMVVGHVQSGKTANYAGLICKAADAGYRLIVVIAGIHNNLRNQTQARIDQGFIGRDTGRLAHSNKAQRQKIIGVGMFDQREFPVSLTNTQRDFNKATATTNTSQIGQYNVPVVLVIKKNPSTLRNLLEWLREHSVHQGTQMVSQPMLLIDDEADNASINTAHSRDVVTRINGQIREFLSLFQRGCYVGYTATPFANIFIDPDTDDETLRQDLFPRHFIIGLDAPSNYSERRKCSSRRATVTSG